MEQRNVGLGRIPCFLCGDGLEVRLTKREKPYVVCDPCGMQVFVRRKEGIGRLASLRRSLEDNGGYPDSLPANSYGYGVLGLVAYLERLEEKISRLADSVLLPWSGVEDSGRVMAGALEREARRVRGLLGKTASKS